MKVTLVVSSNVKPEDVDTLVQKFIKDNNITEEYEVISSEEYEKRRERMVTQSV